MSIKKFFLVSTAFVLSSCATGVTPMGRDTYTISGSSPGLINQGAVKAKLLRRADDWCRKRGLVMVPLNSMGNDAVVGGKWASCELIFRAVPPNDPENKRPTFGRMPDHHEEITIHEQ